MVCPNCDPEFIIMIGNTIYVEGFPIGLTQTEAEVMRILYEVRPRVASWEKIIDDVWGIKHEPSNPKVNVRLHIRSLRKKLAATQLVIHCEAGHGYRLERRRPFVSREENPVRVPL